MHEHLRRSFEVLRNGGAYYMIAGDSALYGIHIRTDLQMKPTRLADWIPGNSYETQNAGRPVETNR